MPRLFVLKGRDAGESIAIRDGMVVGRHPDCDAQLRDRSVSRQHARFEGSGTRWFIADLDSRNGVRIRGERLERAELADHDEILLGELPLRFRLEEADTPAPPPRDAKPPAEASPRPAPPPPPRRRLERVEDAADDVVLEEEIDLSALSRTREGPAPARETSPVPLDEREIARARILRDQKSGGGILGGDLSQRPLWVRTLVTLFLLVVAAGLSWGAFAAVRMLRGDL
jgi:predicted component of type VI protein secretion system